MEVRRGRGSYFSKISTFKNFAFKGPIVCTRQTSPGWSNVFRFCMRLLFKSVFDFCTNCLIIDEYSVTSHVKFQINRNEISEQNNG